jgi:hypothetical protein
MALPQLSEEARKEALKKAAAARSARAELRQKIKEGEITVKEILETEGDSVIDKLKVSVLIESLPGYGKAKAAKLLDEIGISETRRVKGLGAKQRSALLERLS